MHHPRRTRWCGSSGDRPRRVSHEVIWACPDHVAWATARREVDLEDKHFVTGWLQDIDSSPCLICGDDVSHIAFVARDYGPNNRRLEAMNLCARHAAVAPACLD